MRIELEGDELVMRFPTGVVATDKAINMVTARLNVINDVAKELQRQHDKWGDQHHTPEMWLTIEGEEYGEVARAILESQPTEQRAEWIQVAAVAISAVLDLDSGKRPCDCGKGNCTCGK